MFKYLGVIFITIIGFLSLFGVLMTPFMADTDGLFWILCCGLTLSIQMSIIAVYFNNKKK